MYKKLTFEDALIEFKSGKNIHVRNENHLVGTREFKLVKSEDLNGLRKNNQVKEDRDYVVDQSNLILNPNQPQFDVSWDDILNGERYVYI